MPRQPVKAEVPEPDREALLASASPSIFALEHQHKSGAVSPKWGRQCLAFAKLWSQSELTIIHYAGDADKMRSRSAEVAGKAHDVELRL